MAKPNPALTFEAGLANERIQGYYNDLFTWAELLKDTTTQYKAALLFVQAGLKPGELPLKLHQPFYKYDPRVYLFELAGLTLDHKADILNAALLAWAGVFGVLDDLDPDQAAAYMGQATLEEVIGLLALCDLEAFTRRPGWRLRTPQAIRAAFDRKGQVINGQGLADMLRRYKRAHIWHKSGG